MRATSKQNYDIWLKLPVMTTDEHHPYRNFPRDNTAIEAVREQSKKFRQRSRKSLEITKFVFFKI